MDFIQVLSAAGIGGIVGSLVTTVVQSWLSQRATVTNRNFQERKEAYVGFLEALHRSQVEKSFEASERAGFWQNRCELVAPKAVRKLIQRIFETNPTNGKAHPDRPRIVSDLKSAMRVDLGVQEN
jgi:hypothetical protein